MKKYVPLFEEYAQKSQEKQSNVRANTIRSKEETERLIGHGLYDDVCITIDEACELIKEWLPYDPYLELYATGSSEPGEVFMMLYCNNHEYYIIK